MEVIAEVVGAVHAAVPVENSKVGRFFPVGGVFGFGEVEDDGDSVFVVLADGALVGGGRVGSDGAVSVFGVLGGLEVADGHKHFGEHGVTIFMVFDASFLKVKGFGFNENLFPDDFVDLLDGRLGFGAGLVFVVVIFDI